MRPNQITRGSFVSATLRLIVHVVGKKHLSRSISYNVAGNYSAFRPTDGPGFKHRRVGSLANLEWNFPSRVLANNLRSPKGGLQ